MNGTMVISLDFELMWGMLDVQTIDTYGKNVLGARTAVERMLEAFSKYDVHATWGAVGFLFYSDKEELQRNIPELKPQYLEQKYRAYDYIPSIQDEEKDYYFAPELIQKIKDTKGQEVGTHTFCHYYCVEDGQDAAQFEEDLKNAVKVAEDKIGERPRSIIFPRNQMNREYNDILRKYGITAYRGNETAWCYSPSPRKKNSYFKRGCRLLDAYLNVFGMHCFDLNEIDEGGIVNVRSSRMLRPYSKKLSFLEPLRIRRIKRQMTYAAKKGKVFHLWWHPHNFGAHLEENMKNLEELLEHYVSLHEKYGFESRSMREVGEYYRENRDVSR